MKTNELIEYLKTFDQDREVEISICNLNKEGKVIGSDSWELRKEDICINVYHDGAVIQVLLSNDLKKIIELKNE